MQACTEQTEVGETGVSHSAELCRSVSGKHTPEGLTGGLRADLIRKQMF